MCGIFGTILKGRKRPDLGIIRALTLANRERGKESLGFFNTDFDVYKSGDDPIDVLATQECSDFLSGSKQTWGVVGHTRYSTRGAVCDANSHPFTYGDVVGSHNGIIDAPHQYSVDSEYAIDLMDKFDNDIQKALENEWGYWTLSWFNRRDNHLYLSMHDNTCGLVEHDGAWYFSSDPDHLAASLGCKEMIVFDSGDTVRFDNKGRMEWLPKFKSGINYSYKHDYRTSGGSFTTTTSKGSAKNSGSAGSSTVGGWPEDRGLWDQDDDSGKWVNVNDPEGFIRDYDEEFREIWEQYAAQYEDVS